MSAGDAEELRLDTGTLRLAARAHGPADGMRVLALHGWLDNAATFERLAPLLDGLRLVALDFPGHGHSDHRPPGCGYHFVDYVGDVLAAADALGWERFTLLGHSLGGAVAALLAGACPERIERLALIEALGPLTDDAANAPARLAEALARGRRPGTRPPRVYPGIDEAVEARRAAGGLTTGAARCLVERATIADAEGVRWRSDPRLRLPSPYRLTEDQALAFLGAIRAPSLLITARDGLIDPEAPRIARRVEALDDVETCHLPGNHHLHLEDPAPVAEKLGPFLAAAGRAPA